MTNFNWFQCFMAIYVWLLVFFPRLQVGYGQHAALLMAWGLAVGMRRVVALRRNAAEQKTVSGTVNRDSPDSKSTGEEQN
jgi:hypothetical protein